MSMRRETEFVIYCLERYRYYKGLSGAEAAGLFDRYDVYSYLTTYFEVLHAMGDRYIVQAIDACLQRQQADPGSAVPVSGENHD